MKSVRFVKNSPPYNRGEIAGFPVDQANRLIAAGLAVDAQTELAADPADLREDGPTVAEYVAAGYLASNYPPAGYAARSSEAEIAEAVAAEAAAATADRKASKAEKAKPKADAPPEGTGDQ